MIGQLVIHTQSLAKEKGKQRVMQKEKGDPGRRPDIILHQTLKPSTLSGGLVP
jgi:hypothetical protein